MRLHEGVLGSTQRALLRRLSPLAAEHGFYLAGGTGLALQLGHRRSVDFDWFTVDALRDPLRLGAHLRDAGVSLAAIESSEKGTLHARVRGVRVSFLEYRYRLLRPLVVARDGLQVASLEDIACMKLAAVAQRGAKKDFIDIYALGRRFPLAEMVSLYQKKYSTRDIGHLLHALSYFDDADREPMPRLLRDWRWAAIKETVRGWVRELAG